MVCHVSVAEGFSSVMLSEVVGLEFRGVCSSSLIFHGLHLEVKAYCDTWWGIIVKTVISIFLN